MIPLNDLDFVNPLSPKMRIIGLKVFNNMQLNSKGLTGVIYTISKEEMSWMACVRWRFSGDAGEKLDTLSPVSD